MWERYFIQVSEMLVVSNNIACISNNGTINKFVVIYI